MVFYKYVERQLKRLKIDLLTQHTFLAGGVPSIDNNNIIKTDSTNYEEVEIIFFEYQKLKPTDVLIDVGCGKARVFSYLLYKGLVNKFIGYEINPAVGLKTAKRLRRYKNVEIRVENIFDDFPAEGNVFYLYNPFKENMIRAFITKILANASRNPVIIYNTPVHLSFFNNSNFVCRQFEIPVPQYDYTFKFAIINIRQV